jgi:hypothetical protein
MIGEDAYRQIWDSLQTYFDSAVRELRLEFPGIWTQVAGFKNAAAPFIGYASIMVEHDPSRTEDCVLMMEVRRRADRLVVTSDISTGDGYLIATGPTFEIADADPEEAQIRTLKSAEKAAREFFAANLGEVRRLLTIAHQGGDA